ncbi:MAG: Glu-tRNA(Gln) amidotransferase subunit GatD [Candidatus Thermoplasmatota archaeon]|nr:Glu-tRNA(Gln) amidotransferase subunit GatD [Candidatus Thermoplasmatota archaeon]
MVDWADVVFGSTIKFSYSGAEYEGIFIHDDKDIVTVKLSNGYNLALQKNQIELMKIISEGMENGGSHARQKPTKGKVGNTGKKHVSLLATGGTIASKVDYKTGAVSPSEDISFISDRVKDVELSSETIDNILSENITPEKWIYMAGKIRDSLNRSDGCVVFHGTDTMSYSASAISFMFSEQTGPIVFVGSQRSSDRPSSDAFMNAEGAIHMATTDFGEVGIAMHGSISDESISMHRAVRSRKMHTSRRDAFRSIGESEVGTYSQGSVRLTPPYRRAGGKNEIKAKLDPSVSMIYFYPSLSVQDFEGIVARNKAIIIMGTGLGHVSHSLIPSITQAVKEGKKILMTSQCLYGSVNLNVYSTGRELINAGIIPLRNMLPEVALVKAMYVLGNYGEERFEEMMGENLRGEIIERERALVFGGAD